MKVVTLMFPIPRASSSIPPIPFTFRTWGYFFKRGKERPLVCHVTEGSNICKSIVRLIDNNTELWWDTPKGGTVLVETAISLFFYVFIPFGGTVIGLVSYLVTAETDEDRVGFTLVSVVAEISPVSKSSTSATKYSTTSLESWASSKSTPWWLKGYVRCSGSWVSLFSKEGHVYSRLLDPSRLYSNF
jgi:hypothetical protein